ncbi:MAG: acetylxylan esterase [Kiritimatiellales bacterium]
MTSLFVALMFFATGNVLSDYTEMKEKILALGSLTNAPAVQDAGKTCGAMKAVFFDLLPLNGKPVKVFAWVGVPDVSAGKKVPGIVLLHGGGGTAFKEWVELWNSHGFAAIAIATEGQTDEPNEEDSRLWKRHEWSGPAKKQTYADIDRPLEEQWIYHASTATILANSLLRSLPEVDETNVGLMGISWGGVLTSTVMGIDSRFAFAIPVYGCGHLFDSENNFSAAMRDNEMYKNVWDPMVRMNRATMPALWLSWPEDAYFSPISQAKTYRAMTGKYMVSLIPGMGHSHPKGWNLPDSYVFAKSIVETGRPWGGMISAGANGNRAEVIFHSDIAPENALLVSTTDAGFTGDRKWIETPAEFKQKNGNWIATAILPENTTTAWFINLVCNGLTLSSEFQTVD